MSAARAGAGNEVPQKDGKHQQKWTRCRDDGPSVDCSHVCSHTNRGNGLDAPQWLGPFNGSREPMQHAHKQFIAHYNDCIAHYNDYIMGHLCPLHAEYKLTSTQYPMFLRHCILQGCCFDGILSIQNNQNLMEVLSGTRISNLRVW